MLTKSSCLFWISLVLLCWWTTSVTAQQVGLITYSVANEAIEITDYPEDAVGEVETRPRSMACRSRRSAPERFGNVGV